jgi:hypothetical protein
MIESVHSGQRHHLLVSSRVSIKWLAERAKARAGVRTSVDVGALDAFQVRWVLVDSRAEGAWRRLPRHEKRKLRAIVQREDGVRLVEEETAQLDSIGVYDGVVFHLHAVEDEDFDVVLWNSRGPKGTFGGGFVA